MSSFPDFIIAGSAKSGTTAIHLMLDQHPDVYMSAIKETNYFVHGYESTRNYVEHRGQLTLGIKVKVTLPIRLRNMKLFRRCV